MGKSGLRSSKPLPPPRPEAEVEVEVQAEKVAIVEDDTKGPKDFPQAQNVIPFKTNILRHFNGILYDRHKGRNPHHETEVRKLAVKGNFERYQPALATHRFGRRLTEISWHPKEPYLVAAACKFGDLLLTRASYDQNGDLKFSQRLAMKGPGADGAIFSIRFDEHRRSLFYTAGMEGMVKSLDMEREGQLNHEFYNTGDYNHWFTSMDVSQPTRTILAGCTKGRIYLSTLDGDKVAETRLHKGKIFHVQFNQTVPHLIVTSSIDRTVKLWDLRKLTENNPLNILVHDTPVNVAHFSPLNSSRILTSDQKHDIRVYEGPNWEQTLSIKQPHRQFQHLTPVVANWHPLSDIIVIGKYPVVPMGTKAPPRPIQFFDADSGNMIHQLYPLTNEIVSLNIFNPMGDILASGQGRSLLFFNQQEHTQVLSKQGRNLKRRNDDELRFDRGRRISDSEDDDEDEENDDSKKKRKSTRNKKKSATESKKKSSQTNTKRRKQD